MATGKQDQSDNRVNLCWFVDAAELKGKTREDRTDDFINSGTWSCEKNDVVKKVKAGDRIALKVSDVQREDLPFDLNGGAASVMEIRALGTVIKNYGDGCRLDVEWTRLPLPKKWYVCKMKTIWKAERKEGDDYANALLDFIFKDIPQDYDKFLAPPYGIYRYFSEKEGDSEYVKEIIPALEELGGIATRGEILSQIEKHQKRFIFIDKNPNWEARVGTTLQEHCWGAPSYNKNHDALFFSPKRGTWGLVDYKLDQNKMEIEQESEENTDPEAKTDYPEYTREDFLNEVYITGKEYDKLYALIRRKKNIILQGAPGVGKTFAAKRLAYSIMGVRDESRVQSVQFHQSYSYEDFIEGFRPLENGGFKLHTGVFKEFCERASKDPYRDYFFIIDEINRGNLSKIFGELLMLIEADKRGSEYAANLVYSGEPFSVPENLYIIGMMNTADRSLAMIDYALRRRFSFYYMRPAFDSEGFRAYAEKVNNKLFNDAVEAVKSLNREIVNDKSLGRGFEIGHSYFCVDKPDGVTDDVVRNIIAYEVIPTIEEYWFDNEKKLKEECAKLEGLSGEENGAV